MPITAGVLDPALEEGAQDPLKSPGIVGRGNALWHSGLEQTRWIGEGLELERIPAGIAHEERGLFADLSLEAHARLDQERKPSSFKTLRECAPGLHRQDHAEVPHGNRVAIDFVRRENVLTGDVGRQLVTEKVEIDPALGAAPDGTSQEVRIEGARGGDVPDGERQVEGR